VAEALASAPDAVLVDATPTNSVSGEPGLSHLRRALELGHSVVLASKGPLVASYDELVALAGTNGGRIGISAAVGTPLPSVETVLVGLHGSRLSGFRGLFNETSNRIMREMEAGVSYEKAVENAREAGVLETDPRLDLEGWDSAYKVLILARVFWKPDIPLSSASVQGIAGISVSEVAEARAAGKRIRLLGRARLSESGEVEIRIQPVRLDPDDPLYPLEPGEKGAVFESDLMGRFVIRSGKSGPFATAAAIIKDILNMAAHPPVLAV
jgi:homoserine dehydrogenase